MVTVAPLPSLRPRPELAAEVASVPYDVVDTAEARELADGNPHSFLHVTRPEIDMGPETDPHAPEVYRAGAENLARFVAQGDLLRDPEPALYVYRLKMGSHVQTGVLGCCAVDDYDAGRIKKHEHTRPDKEDDRTRHVLELGCHPEPVFFTYPAHRRVDKRVKKAAHGAPLYRFTAADGVEHTVWRLTGETAAELAAAFAEVEALYVADGHHRTAAASRARAARREANPDHHGGEPYNLFLAALFPDDQVQILPYNRVVHDLHGHTPAELLAALRGRMQVSEGMPRPSVRGRFGVYLDGRWYGATVPPDPAGADDPVASLDAAILQRHVLGPLLGVDDPRTSERVDFVGGIRGSEELERRADATGGVAFALHPVHVEELMAVADAGRELPPKSTWFEPKLRSGLVIHEI